MVFDDTHACFLSLLSRYRSRPTRHSLLFSLLAIRKKFEQASAGNRCEFDEHYAFLIDNDAQVLDICQNGYHCTETSFNVLGNYELRSGQYFMPSIRFGAYTHFSSRLCHTYGSMCLLPFSPRSLTSPTCLFCTSDPVDMSLERGLFFAHLHA